MIVWPISQIGFLALTSITIASDLKVDLTELLLSYYSIVRLCEPIHITPLGFNRIVSAAKFKLMKEGGLDDRSFIASVLPIVYFEVMNG